MDVVYSANSVPRMRSLIRHQGPEEISKGALWLCQDLAIRYLPFRFSADVKTSLYESPSPATQP